MLAHARRRIADAAGVHECAATVPGGINLTFMCDDAIALYHEYRTRDLDPSEPEVGNGLWVTQVTDPDGYKLFFESPTDVAEDTKLSEMK